MHSVFEPSVLFISENDWKNEVHRDRFLNRLLDNLKAVDECQITKIYWTSELECHLWNPPLMPPWRKDRDFKLQMVPIIYKNFSNKCVFLDGDNLSIAATASPLMSAIEGGEEKLQSFLKLMHEIIHRSEEVCLCLGKKNDALNEVVFSCACSGSQIRPRLIKSILDWLFIIDLERDFWPKSREDAGRFKRAIGIAIRRQFPNKNCLYSYEFDDQFIDDLLGVLNYKDRIIVRIAQRLVLTQQEAGRDGNLQDEAVRDVFRFRVTPRPSSTRVHYLFNGNKIRFLRYFDVGQHDDGL